ncbi:acylphosphatase [bacterium]|nr:acylphosphatase [bacterium]
MVARAHIIVSGMVQGVGYRYFVCKNARRMELTGWVKNLMSGEVEIEVEGPKGLVESFIQELWTGNAWATVRNVDVRWEPYRGKYTGFDITF